jgi:hypothetical protein
MPNTSHKCKRYFNPTSQQLKNVRYLEANILTIRLILSYSKPAKEKQSQQLKEIKPTPTKLPTVDTGVMVSTASQPDLIAIKEH